MSDDLDSLREHYDDAPYASHAYLHASAEHVAACARLLGVDPPKPSRARVLEIGCSSGGNLIPFALRNPQATAVGVDLSGSHIRRGQRQVERLGLGNVTLHEADIATITGEEYGRFDYIICHGVYSWVPDAARTAIQRVLQTMLTEGGVAYVSYNAYPGWKTKEIIRDAMLLHGRGQVSAKDKASHARSMVGFLRHVAPAGSVLSTIVEDNIYILDRTGEDYLAHDYLEPFNQPFYLSRFVDDMAGHGLGYLGDADLPRMLPENYGPRIAAPLQGQHQDDPAMLEQYLDFASNRPFRQSLLVHGHCRGSLLRDVRPRLAGLHFAARLPCRSGSTRLDGSQQEYGVESAMPLQTTHDVIKLAADALEAHWPGTLSREALVAEVARYAPGHAAALEAAVDGLLEFLVLRGIARCRIEPVELAPLKTGVSPDLDPLVRQQIEAWDPDERFVANRWHESIELDAADRVLLLLMDGQLGVEALRAAFERDTAGLQQRIASRSFEQRLHDASTQGLLAS